jgi:hypothetical protein
MNPNESWLESVPDKYADMLNEGKIDYKTFLHLTEQYQPMQVRVSILRNQKNKIVKQKGFDLIG